MQMVMLTQPETQIKIKSCYNPKSKPSFNPGFETRIIKLQNSDKTQKSKLIKI